MFGSFKHFTKRTKVILSAVLLTVATTAIAGASVMAAIPDSSGKINTCYNNLTKALRVSDTVGNCSVGSTPLSWQQNSPQVTSGKLELSTSDNSQHTLIQLPGFGEIDVNCASFDGGLYSFGGVFKNTSGTSIFAVIPNNQTITIPNGGNESLVVQEGIVLSKGTGDSLRTATLTGLNGFRQDYYGTCDYQAQSLISQS